MKSKRRLLLVVTAILGILFVVRPGANGLRKRIVGSVGMALGRRVEVQWVKLRILPQPGFDLEDFIVYDDPAYGAEPMLRADEVTATLRLRSIFRGRLEIGRLSFKEPSFNLVRREDGHWNIEALLERVAHTPAAPTSHTRPERRPVFPYIEADDGRINFKIGQEKKAYALTDADFALWLESENQWGMRLAARPTRTDFNLSDTGVLHAEGTWQRSGTLRETPLNFSLEWNRAQLGQFTKLISGKDKGWRGGVTLSSTLSGTPADLRISAQAKIEDFHRYDIVSSDSLRLAAACTAHYSSFEHAISNILCQSPLKQGTLVLAGTIQSPTGPRSYDLALLAQDIPVESLVSLARHAKRDLPDDLVGKGLVNGQVSFQTLAQARGVRFAWSGEGTIDNLRLLSASNQTSLSVDNVPFQLSSETPDRAGGRSTADTVAETRLEIGPFAIALGGSSEAIVTGWSSSSGYNFQLQGESQVQRLLSAAQTIGLRPPPLTSDGAARFRLELAGTWADFAIPHVTGSAQLRSVRGEIPGTGPFQVGSATLLLSNGATLVQNLSALVAGTRWTGALTIPRACAVPPCAIALDLAADAIYVDRFRGWLNPKPRVKPWYRVLSPARSPSPSLLHWLNATGRISATRVVFRGLEARDVSAQAELKEGTIRLTDIRGGLLGGQHFGSWEANLAATPPTYDGSGKFDRVSLADLAQAMRSDWISGTGKGTYRFTASGTTPKQALKSLSATLTFDVQNGLLPHLALASSGPPLRVRHFTGQLLLRDGEFKVEASRLDTATRSYQVSGNATLGQKLDLKLAGDGLHGFDITGTLSAPLVLPTSTAETQAALKP